MVCETLINKKLMYRLYAASRLTKICVLLLLILVKQMLDMASIESNKSSSFFLIRLSIWAIVEIVVYFVDQRREAVCILKQYDVKQFRQVVSFEKEVIRVTNVINDTNFEIPYGEIKKLRKKKYLLIFQTKDQHIIILDKLQMSIAQQDELLRIIHKKMPWLRARGLA